MITEKYDEWMINSEALDTKLTKAYEQTWVVWSCKKVSRRVSAETFIHNQDQAPVLNSFRYTDDNTVCQVWLDDIKCFGHDLPRTIHKQLSTGTEPLTRHCYNISYSRIWSTSKRYGWPCTHVAGIGGGTSETTSTTTGLTERYIYWNMRSTGKGCFTCNVCCWVNRVCK